MLSQISTTILCMEPNNPFTFWMALKRQFFLVESATLQRNKSGEYAKYKWTDGPSTDAIDVLLKLAPGRKIDFLAQTIPNRLKIGSLS